MEMGFHGKSAIVTGAGSGIGAEIARELAAEGAKVLVADLSIEAAEEVAAAIQSKGGTAQSFKVDVAKAEQVEAMVAQAVKLWGGLDLAVNNAGIGGAQAPVGEYPLESWKQVIDVNLNGVFYCMRYELAAMTKAKSGAIVNMASILGSVGFGGASAYTAAKHALLGLTKAAALDHSKDGVRINAVGPGFIDTPLLSANLDAATMAALAGLHPVGRIGTPAEVSALTCFLLSDRASFITGSYHLVDGGYTSQ